MITTTCHYSDGKKCNNEIMMSYHPAVEVIGWWLLFVAVFSPIHCWSCCDGSHQLHHTLFIVAHTSRL